MTDVSHDRPTRHASRESSDELITGSRDWQRKYARGVAVTDTLVVGGAIMFALVGRFDWLVAAGDGVNFTPSNQIYGSLSVVLFLAWAGALKLFRTRDPKILGNGVEEYVRVSRATVLLFGWVAIFSLVFKFSTSRGFLALAFPIGLVSLIVTRKLWRIWLQKHRARGNMVSNVLVVGGADSAREIARWMRKHSSAGFRVSGVWVPDRPEIASRWLDLPDAFIPVYGSAFDLQSSLRLSEATTVIVSDTEHLGHHGLKQLSWDLHDVDVDLMVSPNVMDVAGPRIQLHAVANMPFLHLEEPRFEGAAKMSKAIFDRVFAAIAIVLASPILLWAAIAVRRDSEGPILYRSERIGKDGEAFTMLKFRTMVVDADKKVAGLREEHGVDNFLFKMADDPRVTKVGKTLRTYSIDELPQLFNVLRGDMSMVGPRPPLRTEVEAYDELASKRLLVKQGVTGLWQVSGRSDLDWEESVRIDLDYVENWSMLRDLQIIWRTVRAVFARNGAY